jgi:hypothetical protein
MSSPGSLPLDDHGMGRTYALVLVCHAMVIVALWIFGRTFAS